MKKYRSAALALAACAASLSMAACSAGSPAASSSTASSAAATAGPGTAASGPAVPGRMLAVKGSLGSFPVPAAATIGENIGSGSSIIIVFGAITPSDVHRFYATALPKAGYTVTSNTMMSKDGVAGVIIEFSGHGFKGNIDTVATFPESLAVVGDKNVTTILFSSTK